VGHARSEAFEAAWSATTDAVGGEDTRRDEYVGHGVARHGCGERREREIAREKVQLQEFKVLETLLRVLREWTVLR